MATVVAIDVPVDLAPAITEGAVASCQKAIGSGRCVRSETVEASVVPSWYAIVRSGDGQERTLRIEFRRRSSSGEMLALRTLAFSDRDPPESRWVSAGLVIAALVAAEDATPRAPAEPPDTRKPVPTTLGGESNPSFHRASRWLFGIDGGALTGPGLQQGAYRWGAFGRAWIEAQGPGIIGTMTVRYAERAGTASLTWWSLAAGAGIRVGSSHELFNTDFAGEVVVERLIASAVDSQEDRQASGGQTRFGGRFGADLTARITTDVRFLVGADASALTPEVDVQVKNVSVGREPAVRFTATLGLRATF